jgi:peptidyl-dipeptidase A
MSHYKQEFSVIMEFRHFSIILILSLLLACKQDEPSVAEAGIGAGLSAEDAIEFVMQSEQRLEAALRENERVAWVYSTFITSDTERLAALANEKYTRLRVGLAREAVRYRDIEDLGADTLRKLNILRSGITIPAPGDPVKLVEQSNIGARLSSMYSQGEYCFGNGKCLDLGHLNDIMAESRDPDTLLEAWQGWRTVSPPMKDLYVRQVELAKAGAVELGFHDLGTMWRSSYDMQPGAFSAELDRLWAQVKPLYTAMHCHVRARLGEQYGHDLVPQDEPIPAHLLGNMWAQDWSHIGQLVLPHGTTSDYDLDAILKERGFDAITMVKTAEAFFTSLGFERLPGTFWQRSLFVEPPDRQVNCHASAWNLDEKEDLRVKMCIKTNAEDFKTIHHELGHNYYQRAYKEKTHLYRSGANDGFHEAVGDTIALSITPEYLHKIGLLETLPGPGGDIAILMRRALESVAFLPFGLLVDQWRWRVFAGEIGPRDYNAAWWELRERHQGVIAPDERPQDAFDAAAKFHVPGNTPFTRYFLARILQFQFHRSLCEITGADSLLHRCSIFGDRKAGKRLRTMLEMGRSQPWPDALETLTGRREMDASAMLEYFAPLKAWLDEENRGRQCGW